MKPLSEYLADSILACDCPPAESQRLQDEYIDRRDNPPQSELPIGDQHGG